ncbi:MAG: DNA polymerase III subunit beta [Phycisphaeraceae bacterium]|nr:DNA polymerase III subunit beta [Phycisphaeraceae bacterium]MBX3366391.1 DNA polymerase III subunit beta [Phycisphaeraceae bacterium]
MKVICDRSALLNAVNVVSGVVASRSPRPQLTCVKLTAEKSGKAGSLTLSATDAEISIRLRISQVDVTQPGEVLIPADKLRQIVSAEDAAPTLSLESDGDACHIKGDDAHFKVLGYPPADFPAIPGLEATTGKAGFTQDAATLGGLIARTVFATARENTRYAINGVLLKRDGKRMEMVATDGRRLALTRTHVAADKDAQPLSCIVPTKALNMLTRLLGNPDEQVRISLTDNQIVFALGETAVLASNLVEGTFPPYEDVIPKDHDIKVTFDRDVLSSAVRRAALLTNEESRGVRMSFKKADKQVELSSRAPEMGEAEIRVDLAGFDGGDIDIGFNPTFITDALKVIPENQIIMELKSSSKPGLIKSGTDFVYVVMPVSLS